MAAAVEPKSPRGAELPVSLSNGSKQDQSMVQIESKQHKAEEINGEEGQASAKETETADTKEKAKPQIPGGGVAALRKPGCCVGPSTITLSAVASIHTSKISLGGGGVGTGRYYTTQGNNAIAIVERILNNWQWSKIGDKHTTSFTLKWADLRQQIDYRCFREGEQMVNHFPNISILTTKIGLLESIRSSKRKLLSLRLPVHQIIPETYRLDIQSEREEFFKIYVEDELWICKPTGANQGKGIFLVKSLQQVKDKLAFDEAHCPVTRHPTQRIIQRYIHNPLLIEGRKFDIRVYMLLIAGEKSIFAFYREGYIRLSCLPYDDKSMDMTIHLTNQYIQKKHPLYTDVKEDTVWDFEKFQNYLSKNEKLPEDYIATTLTRQLRHLMFGCYHSVSHKLERRVGYFELLGFDFMLDSNYHLWLIEVNINPALHTNCETLKQIIPDVIEETLGMAVEVWSKSRRSRPVFPIDAQKKFYTIFPP
ncbi:PREDICTED: protein polyglycylase TTLL10-like [Amphimedon queenslandica]|uniref:Uncharacterized protein n=1 Tax=Amphimedon queenslandica TaxID=400682 RepID=A0A1X7V7J5_AMPQE|nr:PREDICTED: protein polyglycylase TTLL10-like [Amphimedon queenslandica]|eukprot:XP_003385337.1 PREDICTED: protein polyglycylase TTLL10-like [Amphimedon queenslandica]